MFGSTIFDVAVGVVFVYLLLSLIVTAATEMIAAYLGWRAKNLRDGLEILLKTTLAADLYDHPLIKNLARKGNRPSYISSHTFGVALLDVLANRPSGTGSSPMPNDVRTLLQGVPDPDVRRVLGIFAAEVGQDLEKLRKSIEGWFNDSMDRVAGWYKRKTQAVNLGLAIVLTLAVNVDSLLIVRSLSNDAALRAVLVAQAQELVKEKPAPPKTEEQAAEAEPALEEMEMGIQKLTGLGLSIGWTNVAGPDYRQWPGWLPGRTDVAGWAAMWGDTLRYHFLGWLLTALAASLGAPFWFDILNKIISIRSTGKAPAEKPKPEGDSTET